MILLIPTALQNKDSSPLGYLNGHPLKIYYLRVIQKGFSIQFTIKYEIK